MKPGNRIAGLDLLRAAAILMVLVAHYPKPGSGALIRVLNFGWTGVDLFFVLSGYLIGSQVIKPLTSGEDIGVRAFYWRRFCRTLPAYYVVLAVYFFREASPSWKYLFFMQNLSSMTAFTPSWSLCVEEQFYLLFPLVAWCLAQTRSQRAALYVIPALLSAMVAIRAFTWVAVRPDLLGEPSATATYAQFFYNPTYCRLDGIIFGVAIAACKWGRPLEWEHWLARPWRLIGGSAALLILAVLSLWVRYSFICSTIGFSLLDASFALLVMAGLSTAGPLARFSIPGVEFIAVISYSLYLTHSLALEIAEQVLPPMGIALGSPAGVLSAAVAILLFAAALHYAVERPVMIWRDRRRSRNAFRREVNGMARAQQTTA